MWTNKTDVPKELGKQVLNKNEKCAGTTTYIYIFWGSISLKRECTLCDFSTQPFRKRRPSKRMDRKQKLLADS